MECYEHVLKNIYNGMSVTYFDLEERVKESNEEKQLLTYKTVNILNVQ